jgi:hypothetical protein
MKTAAQVTLLANLQILVVTMQGTGALFRLLSGAGARKVIANIVAEASRRAA